MIYFQLSQILERPNDVLVKDPRIVSLGEKKPNVTSPKIWNAFSQNLKAGNYYHKFQRNILQHILAMSNDVMQNKLRMGFRLLFSFLCCSLIRLCLSIIIIFFFFGLDFIRFKTIYYVSF